MPDGYTLTGPNGFSVPWPSKVVPENLPEGYAITHSLDLTHPELKIRVVNLPRLVKRITAKLPEPKEWTGAGEQPKAADVLRHLKEGDPIDETAKAFAYIGYGNDASRDGLILRALKVKATEAILRAEGHDVTLDDGGVTALLEHIIAGT